MKLSFTKMQGCANDYIYLDCRTSGVPEDIAALSERLSRRHFSIGADGIICICAPVTAGADAMMRIFNADGKLRLCRAVGVQPLGHAADAVAAHFTLAAVRIEDAHHGVCPGRDRCAVADNAVRTDG